MNIDSINNSQLILLVLLITMVTSAAVAVATLSFVYERLARAQSALEQPTIIQQTINRIIEREVIPQAPAIAADVAKEEQDSRSIDVSTIEKALVQLNFGSQPEATGIIISPDGYIISSKPLSEKRQYGISEGASPIFFKVIGRDGQYSLLAPLKPYKPDTYIPPTVAALVSIGQSALTFGGFGEDVRLHSEIVSQKQVISDTEASIRTSATLTEVNLPSAVFVNNSFIGFVVDYSGWVPFVSAELLSKQILVNE